MALVFDPVSPWSYLWGVLAGQTLPVQLAAGLAAGLALALPLSWRFPATGRFRLLPRGAGLLLAVLAYQLLRANWAASAGLVSRTVGSGLWRWPLTLGVDLGLLLLLLVPPALAGVGLAT